eukprot:s7518_g3.t1
MNHRRELEASSRRIELQLMLSSSSVASDTPSLEFLRKWRGFIAWRCWRCAGEGSKPSPAGVGEIGLHLAMARAYALLEQPHSDRPRCLVATVVSRQPRELTDADGRLRLDKHLQDQLMRVLELEIDLGVSKQRLKLAPPESCPEHVEEGPLPTLQRQLVLPENARVLGFKYNEALDPATGFVQVHDLCVLLEEAGRLYLEPLSGVYICRLSQHLPGRARWLPASLEAVERMGMEGLDVTKLPEVQGFQTMRGSMDHIVDSRYQDACAALTFSKLMWWVDLSLLTLALFYIDVLLDVKQLFLFYSAGLHGYLLLNMIGMVLPIMFTSMEAVKFGRTPSPDQEASHALGSQVRGGCGICDIGACTDKLSDLCPGGRFTD